MKILIANRGEIARRIVRTCHAMGLSTVAVYSEADADAPLLREADEAICVGPPPSAASYLDVAALLGAARRTGADAVHPGYGFLAENAVFAQACLDAGLAFVGPLPDTIRRMGSKIEAKRIMAEHGVPVVPGFAPDGPINDAHLVERALEVGLPVLLKASAGGGGKGMRIVRDVAALPTAIAAARRESHAAFGDDTLLVERYIDEPRHIEMQIFGDGHGKVLHLFERECSIQRRHQKIIEETPSVVLERHPELRERMAHAAVTAGQALAYRSAGTVEFIVDKRLDFYFLEINTRLQVEHPVTEQTLGLDLVRMQLELALGSPLTLEQRDLVQRGHSIECRLYAEDPARDFLPAIGTVVDWHLPDDVPGVRLDAGVEVGSRVDVHYDPMLAKLVVHGRDRAEATRRSLRVLRTASLLGLTTNRRYLFDVLDTDAWHDGEFDTHFIDRHPELAAHSVPAEVRDTAAIVATLARVVRRQAPDPSPGLALRPGWRNNRFRPAVVVWEAAPGTEITVQYVALGADRFEVRVGNPDDLARAFATWLRARHPSDDALRDAWHQERRTGLRDDEGLETTVEVVPTELSAAGQYSDSRRRDTAAFVESRTCQATVRCQPDSPAVILTLGGHTTRWRVVEDAHAPDRVWLHGQGETLALGCLPRLPLPEVADAAGGCAAPMPGKILGVLVTSGQPVTAGQPLVIMEAMKMETTVAADRDATVARVLVEPGDQVESNTLLVELTDDDEPDSD